MSNWYWLDVMVAGNSHRFECDSLETCNAKLENITDVDGYEIVAQETGDVVMSSNYQIALSASELAFARLIADAAKRAEASTEQDNEDDEDDGYSAEMDDDPVDELHELLDEIVKNLESELGDWVGVQIGYVPDRLQNLHETLRLAEYALKITTPVPFVPVVSAPPQPPAETVYTRLASELNNLTRQARDIDGELEYEGEASSVMEIVKKMLGVTNALVHELATRETQPSQEVPF